MTPTRTYKQGLAKVRKLWEEEQYDQALARVEELLKTWPDNPPLLVFFAGLVQLQESTTHTLEQAKAALVRAADLDEGSPDAALELGHFLDGVEDDPTAAVESFNQAEIAA